jgi:hypothetical protein
MLEWYWIVLIGFVLYFLGTSWKMIPNEPPHIALVTFLGRRTRWIKKEGLALLPFHPWLFGAILINMAARTLVVEREVQAQHTGKVRVVVQVAWTPFSDFAIEYLNNGKQDGVEEILRGAISDAIRKWVVAGSKRGNDWRDSLETDTDSYIMMLDMVRDLPGSSMQDVADEQKERRISRTSVSIASLGVIIERFHIAEVTTSGNVVESAQTAEAKRFERDMRALDTAQLTMLIGNMMEALHISAAEAHAILAADEGKLDEFKQSLITLKPDMERGKLDELVGMAKALFGA